MLGEERNGKVVTLRFERPEKKNALSIELRDRLSDTLDRLTEDKDTKVVIFTGEGDVFSAGFDLSEFEARDDESHMERLWASSDRYHKAVLQFPLPTIAAINGPAMAGGFDLAVMCDMRIATPNARFAHPEILFGDVVYGPLREQIGGGRARELILTGRNVDAEEALSLGLISQIVPADQLAETANELAQTVARPARALLMRTKGKIMQRSGDTGMATFDL